MEGTGASVLLPEPDGAEGVWDPGDVVLLSLKVTSPSKVEISHVTRGSRTMLALLVAPGVGGCATLGVAAATLASSSAGTMVSTSCLPRSTA